jgi:HD-GYP domain-containing protein (c-di-GMP phosphodiesterase class II)
MFAAAHTYGPIAPDRSCHKGNSHAAAVWQINGNAGVQLDPKVVEAFLQANGIGLIRDNAFQPEENEEQWPTNC